MGIMVYSKYIPYYGSCRILSINRRALKYVFFGFVECRVLGSSVGVVGLGFMVLGLREKRSGECSLGLHGLVPTV